jgi:hypothetical protein
MVAQSSGNYFYGDAGLKLKLALQQEIDKKRKLKNGT